MMDTTDVYKIWGLDKTDFYVCCFVTDVCEATHRYYKLNQTGSSPALAFNYFVSAWMDYVMLDEESQNRCERLMDEFRENWRIVAEAKVKSFIQLLQSSARQPQDITSYDDICVSCIELANAISFSKDLPYSARLFSEITNLMQDDGIPVPYVCRALLYILCAKLMEYCWLSTACTKSLLIEGIRYHMKRYHMKSDCAVASTDLYRLIIGQAICDIAFLNNMENDTIGNEFSYFVYEGYVSLSALDSPLKEYYQDRLYIASGISKWDAVAIRRSILNMGMMN